MDFIERLFGISPDGGDGSTELLYLAAVAAIVLAFAWRRLRRLAAKRTGD
jgi:MYXO-CTERM domain-containing protein